MTRPGPNSGEGGDMRPNKGDLGVDPRGMIFEAYRMELDAAACRAIFLDWAMGSPAGPAEIAVLLDRYAAAHPDHPMTAVLREGLDPAPKPRRRGGPRRT